MTFASNRFDLHPMAERRSGAVLIIVLVTIIILALSAYTFSLLMLTEQKAARMLGQQSQSRLLCESGVDYLRIYLSQDEATIRETGGIWDNPATFQAIPVSVNLETLDQVGRFTIVSSNLDSDGTPEGFRYGLMDESTKLNLNTLTFADSWIEGGGRQLLMALPAMTEDVADAILDWLDEDDEVREFGAEFEYYAALNPPYAPKNGPMDSIEELLLIRGVTPQLMFGNDSNHNGILDPHEEYGSAIADGDLELGWANYLTLFSKEANLNRQGLKRVNINSEDLEQLQTELRSALREQWVTFILAYRQNGPYNGEDESDPTAGFLPVDINEPARFTFNQVLDLVDARTTVKDPESEEVFVVDSPIQSDNLSFTVPILMEHLTTQQGASVPGRINIMQAPRRVLESIPGLEMEAVDEIMRIREFELDDPDGADLNRNYETWILVEGIVDLNTMRLLLPFVCTGGDVYRAEIVGYFDDGANTSRAEVIVDTTEPIPRILFWRDKSHLQSGYSVDTLGVEFLQ